MPRALKGNRKRIWDLIRMGVYRQNHQDQTCKHEAPQQEGQHKTRPDAADPDSPNLIHVNSPNMRDGGPRCETAVIFETNWAA
jgi:hypothetical protein